MKILTEFFNALGGVYLRFVALVACVLSWKAFEEREEWAVVVRC